jgi:hypothetical protein
MSMMKNPFPQMQLPPELVYEFLGTFARCEYALKASGFIGGNQNRVWPEWENFADSVADGWVAIDDQSFKEAAKFLLTESPQKQVFMNHQVTWKTSVAEPNFSEARNVLAMVRCVRNNLFHGGKGWSLEHRERDVQLVKTSLLILQECMKINKDVEHAFEVGTF